MDMIGSQITSLTIVYLTVYSAQIKKISKLCVTGLCAGNSPATSEFLAQRASNAENVSIWWRHQVFKCSESSCCFVCSFQELFNEMCWCISTFTNIKWHDKLTLRKNQNKKQQCISLVNITITTKKDANKNSYISLPDNDSDICPVDNNS